MRRQRRGQSRGANPGRPKASRSVLAQPESRRFFIVLFLSIAAALLNDFRIDKHLSADGVLYFTSILDSGDFYRVDATRRFAEYATQWPLVLAVRAGLSNVPALSAVYALGLFLPVVFGFAICLFAVRGERATPLCLPLLVLATVSLPSDYILAGEHHVMTLLASPILLLILRRSSPTAWDGIALVSCLAVFTRTYPSAVASAFLFAVLITYRLISERSDHRAALIRGVALLLCLATLVLGTSAILNPRDLNNREQFWKVLAVILVQPEIVLVTAASTLFLIGLAIRLRTGQMAASILAASSLALSLPYVLGARYGLSAHQSVAARTLTATLLPTLLLLAVLVHVCAPRLSGFPKVLLAGIVLTVVAGSFVHSAHWARYRGAMKDVLRTARGFVPVERTRLLDNPCRWGWASPGLSVVWSFPVVRAIVENPRGEPWVPFDPRLKLLLQKYVRYDPVFAGVDPGARIEQVSRKQVQGEVPVPVGRARPSD